MTAITLDSILSVTRPETSTDKYALGKYLQKLGESMCAEAKEETESVMSLLGENSMPTIYGRLELRTRTNYEFEHPEIELLEQKKYSIDSKIKKIQKQMKEAGTARIKSITTSIAFYGNEEA